MNDDQKCKKFKTLKVYITGYGIFEGVDDNPSELLVKRIDENKDNIHKTFDNHVEIHHTEVFKVAISHVAERTNEIYDKIAAKLSDCKEDMILIVHLGVDMGAKAVCLESQCVNAFSGTDVEGCTIDGKINKELCHQYKCKLDLEKICPELAKSNKVSISTDAGDYLCNYVYFLSSTKYNEVENVHSIFIHVPAVTTMSVDETYKCFFDFLTCVRKNYII